jgi:hypothetical protein
MGIVVIGGGQYCRWGIGHPVLAIGSRPSTGGRGGLVLEVGVHRKGTNPGPYLEKMIGGGGGGKHGSRGLARGTCSLLHGARTHSTLQSEWEVKKRSLQHY